MKRIFDRIPCRLLFASLVLTLSVAGVCRASDGTFDANDEYPAVGAVFFLSAIGNQLDFAGGYCSGSLIAPDVFLTAAHCIFYDSRRRVEMPGYQARYWVSFDKVATENDFYCYLEDNGVIPPNTLCSGPTTGATFHAGVIGVTDPAYAKITGNQNPNIHELPFNYDLAVIILAEPVTNITPLQTAAPGTFDDWQQFKDIPLVSVGYGLDLHKSVPATPDQPGGPGPTTIEGPAGVRRVADLGTLRVVNPYSIAPTERSSLGEDSICTGDSGGPLFLGTADGTVDQTISGTLTGGGTKWCIGDNDVFTRVDTPEAVGFLSCIESAATIEEACRCGAEDQLGLCD